MKSKYMNQAKQLYKALKARGQTWTRTPEHIANWAVEFQELCERDKVSSKRIQRVLDWYCEHGIGAIYVPIAATGEAFRAKFDAIDKARKRLKGQTLRYFDDVLDYKFSVCRGSRIQREYRKVSEKIQQQIELVDDLVNGRSKLPKENRREAAIERLTKEEKRELRRLLIIDREIVWGLLMQIPGVQEGFERRLMKAGLHKRIRRYIRKSAADKAPF